MSTETSETQTETATTSITEAPKKRTRTRKSPDASKKIPPKGSTKVTGNKAKKAVKAAKKEKKPTRVRVDGLSVWRVAKVHNPKTERDVVLIEVGVNGTLRAGGVKRTGLKHVNKWTEVRASGRKDAIARIAKGEGKVLTRK